MHDDVRFFFILTLHLASVFYANAQSADVNVWGNVSVHHSGNITFYGDFSNNGSFSDSGETYFSGSSHQIISGDSLTTFDSLVINNSSTSGVSVYTNVSVRSNIDFMNGLVNTFSDSILISLDGSGATNAHNNSFVNGPMRKIGDDAFTFPIGKSASYAPLSISSPSATTDEFEAEYIDANPHPTYDTSSRQASIVLVSTCEYWTLNEIQGSSNVNVTLSWDSTRSCLVSDPAELLVTAWDGTQWIDYGYGSHTGNDAEGTVTGDIAAGNFGPFTIGYSSEPSFLPIRLLSFSGFCEEEKIVFQWTTLMEINNDYFTLERSYDLISWEPVARIPGSGNSNAPAKYSFDLPSSSTKVEYFRLRQTDFDGLSETHDVLVVYPCKINNHEILEVYPNPTSGIVNISINYEYYHFIGQKIYNASGDLISQYPEYRERIDLTHLPPGVYFLVVEVDEVVLHNMFVIEE